MKRLDMLVVITEATLLVARKGAPAALRHAEKMIVVSRQTGAHTSFWEEISYHISREYIVAGPSTPERHTNGKARLR